MKYLSLSGSHVASYPGAARWTWALRARRVEGDWRDGAKIRIDQGPLPTWHDSHSSRSSLQSRPKSRQESYMPFLGFKGGLVVREPTPENYPKVREEGTALSSAACRPVFTRHENLNPKP